jgi:hypothetical protein
MGNGDITRESFIARLKGLGLRQASFAERSGVAPATIYHWGTLHEFPGWVPVLLDAWERLQMLEGSPALEPRKRRRRSGR